MEQPCSECGGILEQRLKAEKGVGRNIKHKSPITTHIIHG